MLQGSPCIAEVSGSRVGCCDCVCRQLWSFHTRWSAFSGDAKICSLLVAGITCTRCLLNAIKQNIKPAAFSQTVLVSCRYLNKSYLLFVKLAPVLLQLSDVTQE